MTKKCLFFVARNFRHQSLLPIEIGNNFDPTSTNIAPENDAWNGPRDVIGVFPIFGQPNLLRRKCFGKAFPGRVNTAEVVAGRVTRW